ncbi:MAG: PAS domain S-box protein [Betaproteobacteria bacterium]
MLSMSTSSSAPLDRTDFKTIFESLSGLFVVVLPDDPRFTIVAATNDYLKQTMTTREAIIGQGFYTVFPEEDPAAPQRAESIASFRRVIEHRSAAAMGAFRFDIPKPEADGGGFEERHWRVVRSPVFTPQGVLAYIILHTEDVSEIIEGQSRLNESQDSFRLIVEDIKDYAIFMLDPEGRIISWNKGARHLKQYEAAEIVGKHFSVFYSPKDLLANKPALELQAAKTDGRCEDEGWRLRRDGTRFWANVVITALVDQHGALIGFSKVTRDLTERKQHEDSLALANAVLERRVVERTEELRESEIQFLTFADSMPQLAWIAKADGYISWFNRGWYEYTGTTPADMEGWGWQVVHDPVALPGVMAEWKRSMASQKPMELTFQIKGADGIFKWFLTRVTPVFNAKGTLVRWFGTNTNIDEASQALFRANKELEAFSYSVSHDLRAPLRHIDRFSRLLLRDSSEGLDDTGRHYLSRICSGTRTMGILIDALLNLARVSQTRMTFEAVDLTGEAKRILKDLQQSEPQRSVDIIVPEGIAGHGDPELIRVLLQNLLSNAWKFTAKKKNPSIKFGDNREKGQTVYSIQDTGAGFDMTYVDKLFGTFERLHSDSEFEGTGIGLATVQRIVQRHGGAVWAQGEPGKGATFFFTLGRGANGARKEA